MNNATVMQKVEKVEDRLKKISKSFNLFVLMIMALSVAFPQVFADAAGAGEEVIQGVLGVIFLITNIIGIIFVMVGFVKLVVAWANEDGPSQQKAAQFVATGLGLILLRVILNQIGFASWINTQLTGD